MSHWGSGPGETPGYAGGSVSPSWLKNVWGILQHELESVAMEKVVRLEMLSMLPLQAASEKRREDEKR